jgi:threonine aldolase
MIIDLRSDTVTKPTPAMLEAMFAAKVGDDVFGEDPTILALEKKCAEIFGMDDGLFCPSGTMTNQIGLKILTSPGDEVICYSGAHIYRYEGGGAMANSGISMRFIDGDHGVLNALDIDKQINPDDEHFPETSVVALENTVNKGGGCYYTVSQIKEIAELCQEKELKMHLDGARIFNALEASGDDATQYGKYFDTISICLSKGLGAPVGSVLLFKEKYARKAKRARKMFGGGMRQAGYLAAAGIHALDHHVERLQEDHQKAKRLAEVLSTQSYVKQVVPVHTNIVIFELINGISSELALIKLEEHGVKAVPFGAQEVRFVTHLDFTDEMLDRTIEVLKKIFF